MLSIQNICRASPRVLFALAVWLGVGFSLGWYYTFTYYGRTGWPMPVPEVCGALILYYFSVLNADTEIQAIHWMLVFPFVGLLWAGVLRYTSLHIATEMESSPSSHTIIGWLALAALPMALPGPVMAWIAGSKNGAFSWDLMMMIALRHGGFPPPAWLTPLFFGIGLLSFILQLGIYRHLFGLSPSKAWRHYPIAMVAFTLCCCLAGGLAAFPLRLLFE